MLERVDSYELTEWMAFFQVKAEDDADDKPQDPKHFRRR